MSSSALLGNRVRFPSYFQLLATIERTATGYYGVIRTLGWKKIAFIVQDENLWTVVRSSIEHHYTNTVHWRSLNGAIDAIIDSTVHLSSSQHMKRLPFTISSM